MPAHRRNSKDKVRKFITFIVLATFLLSCAPVKPYVLTNYFRSTRIEQKDIKRVAILPFENLTNFSEASSIATDEFNLQLGKLGTFDLVERLRVEELFKEQDLDTIRFDPITVAKIGRMLGAQGVIFGSVTNFTPHPEAIIDTTRVAHEETPPVIIISDHHDDKDFWKVACIIGAVITVIPIVYILLKSVPSAQVGISARLVDVETGEQLWQAKDLFKGSNRSVQALVENRENKKRLVYDVEYLNRILCQEMAKTLLNLTR